MNNSRTPGGNRLKALREYLGKTQLDVELDASLGIGYLQRVEAGKVKHPERDTLERILGALGVRYTEWRDVLELFGYIVGVPLPTEEELRWAVNIYQSELMNAVFPAYLLDCQHRILAWNGFVPKLYKMPFLNNSPTPANRISMLNILFDPTYKVTPRIANPEVFFLAQIRALHYEMYRFRNESWHNALIEGMRQYPLFEKYWSLYNSGEKHHIAARPLVPFELRSEETGVDMLQFRIISETFAQDQRFRVIYCLPAEPQTMQQCLAWL